MSKYRESARGEMCQIRIPGHCNFNPETTVLAHLNGGGMALKHSDIHGAFACSSCHDIVDGRKSIVEFTKDEIKLMHLEGIIRTQNIWLIMGVLSDE